MRQLLAPQSLVVFGASRDVMTISGRVLDSLQRFNFRGEVFPLSMEYEQIAGYQCVSGIDALPPTARPEAALIAVPAGQVLSAVEACASKGIAAVTIIAGGFAESGDSGLQLQVQLRQLAQRTGLVVCGPNCLGAGSFADGYPGFAGSALGAMADLKSGPTALVCQSGGLANAIMAMASDQEMFFSHVISTGNEAVTPAHQYIDFLRHDARIHAILTYLEQIREPDQFLDAAARSIAQGKPVIVLKAAQSDAGSRVASSHTGALGGNAAVLAGAFQEVGILQVNDVDELLDIGKVLSLVPKLDSHRVGVFSQIGGGAAIAADWATKCEIDLPELANETVATLRGMMSPLAHVANPMDPIAGFARKRERFRNGLEVFARDPNFDFVVFISVAGVLSYANDLCEDITTVAAEIDKPFICVWLASESVTRMVSEQLRPAGILVYSSISRAMRAIAGHRAALSDRTPRRSLRRIERPETTIRHDAFDVTSVESALARHGLQFPQSVVTSDPETAVRFAKTHGEVAVKLHSKEVHHKSDEGGVRLGIKSEEEVRAAVQDTLALGRQWSDEHADLNVQVQAMALEGTEVLVGTGCDREMGPYICVGSGGIFTEIYKNVAFRLLPVEEESILNMLRELKIWPILNGFRGSAVRDIDALVRAVQTVAEVAESYNFQFDIELNPVIVHEKPLGCTAVDCLVLSSTNNTKINVAQRKLEEQR